MYFKKEVVSKIVLRQPLFSLIFSIEGGFSESFIYPFHYPRHIGGIDVFRQLASSHCESENLPHFLTPTKYLQKKRTGCSHFQTTNLLQEATLLPEDISSEKVKEREVALRAGVEASQSKAPGCVTLLWQPEIQKK